MINFQTISRVLAAAAVAAPAMAFAANVSAANVKGTCADTGSFTATGSCTVLDGETVDFVIVGGTGGNGGAGGIGGDGGAGWNFSASAPGSPGSPGGPGGAGGLGAKVTGSYTNSTGATVTLTLTVGAHGDDGLNGNPGTAGTDATGPGYVSGGNGAPGDDGAPGQDGTDSAIGVGAVTVVKAGGGTAGLGGAGGAGGAGAVVFEPVSVRSLGSLVLPGADGEPGSVTPDPLPSGWSSTNVLETPGVTFTGVGVAESTTTTVPGATTTTTAPAGTTTTTVAEEIADEEVGGVGTPMAASEMPGTGGDADMMMAVTAMTLYAGVAFWMASRRRVVR